MPCNRAEIGSGRSVYGGTRSLNVGARADRSLRGTHNACARSTPVRSAAASWFGRVATARSHLTLALPIILNHHSLRSAGAAAGPAGPDRSTACSAARVAPSAGGTKGVASVSPHAHRRRRRPCAPSVSAAAGHSAMAAMAPHFHSRASALVSEALCAAELVAASARPAATCPRTGS